VCPGTLRFAPIRRSLLASKQLVNMGYTRFADFRPGRKRAGVSAIPPFGAVGRPCVNYSPRSARPGDIEARACLRAGVARSDRSMHDFTYSRWSRPDISDRMWNCTEYIAVVS